MKNFIVKPFFMNIPIPVYVWNLEFGIWNRDRKITNESIETH